MFNIQSIRSSFKSISKGWRYRTGVKVHVLKVANPSLIPATTKSPCLVVAKEPPTYPSTSVPLVVALWQFLSLQNRNVNVSDT